MSTDREAFDKAAESLKQGPYKSTVIDQGRKYLLGESQLKREDQLTDEQKTTLKAARAAQGWWMKFWAWILAGIVFSRVLIFLFQFITLSVTYIVDWKLWSYHLLGDAMGIAATLLVITLVATRFSKFQALLRQVNVACIIASVLSFAVIFAACLKGGYYWRRCATAGWIENLAIHPGFWVNDDAIALCGQYSGWATWLVICSMYDGAVSLATIFIIWYLMTANDNWALQTYRRKHNKDVEDFYNQDPIGHKIRAAHKIMKKDMQARESGYRAHHPSHTSHQKFIDDQCGVRNRFKSVELQGVQTYK